jgi:hypothetical protein
MVKTKTKTKKAATKNELNRIYGEFIVPFVLNRDPWCKRCNKVRSQECHHRKGRSGEQSGNLVSMLEEVGVPGDRIESITELFKDSPGINLTIYAPLIVGLCSDCHRHIEINREESYREHWLYHRIRGELPEGWEENDYVLNPDAKIRDQAARPEWKVLAHREIEPSETIFDLMADRASLEDKQ